MTELEYLNAILSVNEGDMEGIWFTTQNYHPIRANVLCSDFFHWACADCEVIEHDDIESFMAAWNWGEGWMDHWEDDASNSDADWRLLWATWKRKYVPDTLAARVKNKHMTTEVADLFKLAATGEKFWETVLP